MSDHPEREERETAQIFRALSEPARLRLWQALREEELLSGEVAEFLGTGPTTASGMLKVLKDAGLIQARPEGRRVWYSVTDAPAWLEEAAGRLPEADREQLRRLLRQREEDGPDRYQPGRSWEGLAGALLSVSEWGVVADLGVGTGELTLLLAGSARRLYAVDRSAAALASLMDRALAARLTARITTVEQDLADFALPEPADLVCCSQTLHHLAAPVEALCAAHRALRPGGRLLIMELARHSLDLGHRWPGFTPRDLGVMLYEAGFNGVDVRPAAADRRGLRTLLAVARKD